MSFLARLYFRAFGATASGKVLHSEKTCAECGSKLCADTGSEDWRCPNPDCPAQVRRWLAHWCSPAVMDVPGGDERLIALLVERGLARDVAELYRIKVKELAALPGMDQISAQKFFDALTASLKREAWRLLCGLNIPLIGVAEAQTLLRVFPTVDAVFAAGVPRLMKDAGVSEEAARSLSRWHSDSINRKLLRRLEKAGANFKSELYQGK